VSHELKTPLMSIRGFAQMIRDGDVDAEEAREFGGEIHDNAVRLSGYVERILQEDSVHNGRATLQLEEVDVGALIDEVVHSLGNLAGDRHRVVNLVNGNTPPVAADPDKLGRIILNLVGNAIKYSPDGGEVVLSARGVGRDVELVVQDEGLGIPADARERIFDRFYRVETPRSRNINGTGLGLSIVKGLVELHGGRIWVEPGEERGSRFIVTLPQAGALSTAAAPADHAHTPCLEET
jgi:signal transduction histidine kinase